MATLKITKGPNVSTDAKNLVAKLTKQCLREMSKKKYEITRYTYVNCPNITYKEMLCDINIHVKKRGQRSNGGKNGITIDISRYLKGKIHCLEYPAYKDNPIIGEFRADPETALLGIVAHEVAHFIQYRYGPSTRHLKNNYSKAHGEGFQWIYSQLRREVVNPRIEANKLKETTDA